MNPFDVTVDGDSFLRVKLERAERLLQMSNSLNCQTTMMTYDLSNAAPHMAIPVGEYIQDELKDRKMSQKELAAAMGVPASRINEVIKGKRPLSAGMALQMEKAIGIPAHILLSLQSQYELDKARLKEQEDRNKTANGDYDAKRKNLLIAIQQFIEVCKASGRDVPDELMNLQLKMRSIILP